MKQNIALSVLAMVASAGLAASTPAEASSFHVVYSFHGGSDGFSPFGQLTNVGGVLWGTAQLGSVTDEGVVFEVYPVLGVEKVRYAFQGGSDGSRPQAGLTDVLGTLYGTTNAGGSGTCSYGIYVGCGTVFAINPVTGAEKVVYSFQGGGDGIYVESGLINVGGTLYGTTSLGGGGACSLGFFSGCGTVFAVNPKSGTERVIYTFGGGKDGAGPQASLSYVDGQLFGTTSLGGGTGCGGYGCGTVFVINPKTGTEKILHAFAGGSDGGQPQASLINVGGMLYGTTYLGGIGCGGSGCGTVFSVNPKTGVETVVYAFHGDKDGGRPAAGLTSVGGMLYGTTVLGGDLDANCTTGCGTVFEINPKTGAETVVQAFKGLGDGANPYSGLVNIGGSLYGTTEYGGAFNRGSVYVVTP